MLWPTAESAGDRGHNRVSERNAAALNAVPVVNSMDRHFTIVLRHQCRRRHTSTSDLSIPPITSYDRHERPQLVPGGGGDMPRDIERLTRKGTSP
jgi:hypothetical protein